jgi:hypothetical protein
MFARRLLVGCLGLALVASACADERAPARTIQRGRSTACDEDSRTLKTAEETYFALNQTYASEAALVPQPLAEQSTLHDVVLLENGSAYKLVIADPRCGTVGHDAS